MTAIMDELRVIREEIKTDLVLHRKEHRQDIKDLHDKIEKHYIMLSGQFAEVVTDVAVQGSSIKHFSALISILVGGVTAWIVSHFKSGSGL